MKKSTLFFAPILGLMSLFSQQSESKTIYVADQIPVETRTGPTTGYRIPFWVKPGTELEILQTNAETGYTEFRDPKGRTAWIAPKYVSEQPTVHIQFEQAKSEIARLKSEFSQKESQMMSRINQLSPLEQLNSDLQNQLAQAQTELEQSRQKAQLYQGGFNRDAFFGGAAVLLGGMFIGWIFSKFGGRRKNDGWN